MSKLPMTGALSLFLWTMVASAAPQIIEESLVNYQAKKGQGDLVQLSTSILPLEHLAEVPAYADPYQLRNETDGIRNFVVVRSTFTLNLGLDEIKKRTDNPLELTQFSSKFKVRACDGRQCQGHIVTSLANNNVSFVSAVVDRNAAGWENTFKGLNNPDLIVAQRFTKIQFAFESGSNFAAFYKVSNDETWVQSFQFFMIRESAYKIPFINLNKKIKEIIKDMLIDGRSAILQENGVQRTIQSVREPAADKADQDLYKQSEFLLVDPVGDAALLERARKVPKSILKELVSFSKKKVLDDPWLPEASELIDPLSGEHPAQPVGAKSAGISIQGRENPLLLSHFTATLDQVLLEESRAGLNIRLGEFHEWAPETKARPNASTLTNFSKLFVSLAQGFTNWFMVTGTEPQLREWILKQPVNSITLHEMIRSSLRINEGNVYLSLLTIENVLSSNWRYAGREALPTTLRLRPITSGHSYEEDKYGSWYHFFGMILWGYYTGQGFKAKVVGKVEGLGSNILSPAVDKTQKQWFNVMGGYVGEHLRRSVVNGKFRNSVGDAAVLNEDFYLNRQEDFRDRLPVESSSGLKVQIGGQGSTQLLVTIENLGSELNGCKLDVMLNTGFGYRSDFRYSYALSLASGQKWVLNVPRENMLRGVRAFFSACEKGESRSVELDLLRRR